MWYCDYDDLDKSTVDYLLSISGASKISDLTMSEINSFLSNLIEWEQEYYDDRKQV